MATATANKPIERTKLSPETIAGQTPARVAWIAQNLRIETQAGTISPLAANSGQITVWLQMARQEAAGLPVRLIVLKARRTGCSTGVQSDYFARVHHLPNRHALTIAHLADSTEVLFRMSKRFQEHLPKKQRRVEQSSNRKELLFAAPHGSSMRIETAGSPEAARSAGYQYVHCSEFAFWEQQAAAMAAITSTVPYAPGTCIIIESTANGVGDDFHRRWQEATRRLRNDPNDLAGFMPVFISWLTEPSYRQAVPAGYDWAAGAEDDVREDEPTLRGVGAADEQLYWRRLKIRDDFGGDVDGFRAEYPSTPDEAFITSGRPVCPAYVIAHHRKTVQDGRKARLYIDTRMESGIRVEFEDDYRARTGQAMPAPFWRIWRVPQEQGDYAIAGDVAEGGLSDPNNPGSEPDNSYGFVMERHSLEDCAEYINREEADLFGLELLKAHIWYNRGWVTPEANAMGQASLLVLKRAHCSRIMQRVAFVDSITQEPKMADGYKTTEQNRAEMLTTLLQYLRPNDLGEYEGCMVVRSAAFLDELATFIKTKTGKWEHMSGCHDDSIFARAIALQVHLKCPRLVVPQVFVPRRRNTMREMAVAGAVDYGPWNEGTNRMGGGVEESK